jgi:uncharacterized protein (DUF1501 family)
VVSLRGGFDGLSAVDPAGDPDHLRLRPTVGIPASRLHQLDSRFGLHPALSGLMPLWRNGTLAVYPEGELGPALRDVARLIRADVGLRVACIDYGEWDLHAGMGDVDRGAMTDRLGELGSALAAFATDLGAAAMSRVCLVTLSEFGRRVAENGSGGTDHRYGNTVFLLGGGVVGGRVHGGGPGLSAPALVDGDLPGRTDYRVLLAEVLRERCGVRDLSAVVPGPAWSPLGVTRNR